jgi:hypothetical protein
VLIPALTPAIAFDDGGYGRHAGFRAPSTVCVCFQHRVLQQLDARWALREARDWPLGHHPYRRLHLATRLDGVGVLHLEIGGPLAHYALSTCVHFGARRIWLLTSAGSPAAGGMPEGLFRVASAQRLAASGGLSACRVAEHGAGAWEGRADPVHALTVERFFRREALRATPSSSLPCVLEMEAHDALGLGKESGVEIEVLGYVSDVFDAGRWRRRPEIASLQERLVDLVDERLAAGRALAAALSRR